MNDLEQTIRTMFCEDFNDKGNEKDNYEEYLTSMKKDELEKLFKLNAIIKDDNVELMEAFLLSKKKKSEVIKQLVDQSKEIYTNLLIIADENIIMQLKSYLKEDKNGVVELDFFDLKYTLHFISSIRRCGIAKVKYDKNKNKIYLYTPIELRDILIEILKDKKIKKESKKNSTFKTNLHSLIATYGVISVKDACEIYNKVYGKIDEETIINRMTLNLIFDDSISIVESDEGYIIYTAEFEDGDEALEFYYSLPEDLDYKVYTKDDYEAIEEGYYHTQFDEFEELCDYLEMNFDMDEEEIFSFNEMHVLDYMFSYQLDKDTAKRNLSFNLEKWFGKLNINDRAYISGKILSIARNYPNFNYKGYTYNEIKNKNV